MKPAFQLVTSAPTERRRSLRRPVRLPARLIWRDRRGTARIASVVIANASEQGVLVETVQGSAIPLFRLVDVYVERVDRDHPDLPDPLRRAHVLAAVYRVGPFSPVTGVPEYYALRLLVKPDVPRVRPQSAEAVAAPADRPSSSGPCRSLTA